MSAILKQKLIDIANGFTKYGLWKGGGSSALSEMTDVTLTNLQSNDVLTYNGSVWVNDDSLQKQIDTLNSNLTRYAKFKDISVDTDSEGNALIGGINAVIPLSCIPITVGVSISSILCNGYGLYYAKTDAYNKKITVRVTYTDYQ